MSQSVIPNVSKIFPLDALSSGNVINMYHKFAYLNDQGFEHSNNWSDYGWYLPSLVAVGIASINMVIEEGDSATLIETLKSPDVGFLFVKNDCGDEYLEDLRELKEAKAQGTGFYQFRAMYHKYLLSIVSFFDILLAMELWLIISSTWYRAQFLQDC